MSDKDGEVVAAAAAIMRTLKAEGMDIHGLADALYKPPEPAKPAERASPRTGLGRGRVRVPGARASPVGAGTDIRGRYGAVGRMAAAEARGIRRGYWEFREG